MQPSRYDGLTIPFTPMRALLPGSLCIPRAAIFPCRPGAEALPLHNRISPPPLTAARTLPAVPLWAADKGPMRTIGKPDGSIAQKICADDEVGVLEPVRGHEQGRA